MITKTITKDAQPLANTCFMLLAAGFIGICSQIAIPIGPVPITGQTFAIMLIGALLGPKSGALAVVIYLLEGAAYLPVFPGTAAGAHLLLGPTGGYFLGFPCLAASIGYITKTDWSHELKIAAYTASAWLILAIGTLWLAQFTSKAISLGFTPFLGIEFAKALVVYWIYTRTHK
ncbi:MAG: biotin transporter BioY [Chlamydiales bacterium]|nr:biotin transporter BioY [Chlamydiales bacterium]